MTRNVLTRSAVVTVFAIVGIAAAVYSFRSSYTGIRAGKADANYIKSGDCRVCHEDHYASWERTHHSKMTQEARPATVQGDFERQNTYQYEGSTARMERHDDAFFMNIAYADGTHENYKIERTIGSRRVEQYVAKVGNQYFRL